MTCTPEMAARRAELNRAVRAFFSERGVLEVETPVLSRGVSTDCHIDVFAATYHANGFTAGPGDQVCYLQTSPEPHMKRLLAAGYPDIFQISRVFRNGEAGARHNPEFTMLEWYRRGMSMDGLMEEVADLCRKVLGHLHMENHGYGDLFARHTGLDPFEADLESLRRFCEEREPAPPRLESVTDALQFIMAVHVEPKIPHGTLCFVTGFPAAQASLAALDPVDPRAAQRFELYHGGCELANGYSELVDAGEARRRMAEDNRLREGHGKPRVPVDEAFLSALGHGLPHCSGVALGMDRLLMLAARAATVAETLTFPWGTH